MNLPFFECRASHNDKIFLAKILSLILDDLYLRLQFIFMCVLKELKTISNEACH